MRARFNAMDAPRSTSRDQPAPLDYASPRLRNDKPVKSDGDRLIVSCLILCAMAMVFLVLGLFLLALEPGHGEIAFEGLAGGICLLVAIIGSIVGSIISLVLAAIDRRRAITFKLLIVFLLIATIVAIRFYEMK